MSCVLVVWDRKTLPHNLQSHTMWLPRVELFQHRMFAEVILPPSSIYLTLLGWHVVMEHAEWGAANGGARPEVPSNLDWLASARPWWRFVLLRWNRCNPSKNVASVHIHIWYAICYSTVAPCNGCLSHRYMSPLLCRKNCRHDLLGRGHDADGPTGVAGTYVHASKVAAAAAAVSAARVKAASAAADPAPVVAFALASAKVAAL